MSFHSLLASERMRPLIELLKKPLLYVAGFSFVVNLLMLAPALFMLQVFDRVLTSQSRDTLLILLLGVGVALGLMAVLDYVRGRLQGVFGNLVAEQLSPGIAKAMLAQLARRRRGVQPEGLRDVAVLRNLFSAQGLLAIFDVPWALVYVTVIWLCHPMLGMAAAASSALMLLLAFANDRLTRSDIEALQQEAAQSTRYLESSLQNAETVEQFGMANALVDRWRALNSRVARLQGRTARKSVAMAAVTRAARQSVQVLMQALGAYLVISGDGTPGILVATTILLARALAPVEQVVGSWRVLAEGRLAFARVSAALQAQDAQPPKMSLPMPTGRLQAEGLVYRAPQGDKVILAGVSLRLEPGESLAIIGPSGAGKSTLARLLTGLWKPDAGVVRLDHADLADWSREELGPWLGYVAQDVRLFPGTIADNISRLGAVDAERVVEAARRAGVHELILALPQGYDTVVDSAGSILSPGQCQRIALARALYGTPKLLVLDEPNSNLDGAGEQALSEALAALKGHVTVVVITHRTALLQHVDKLLVLEAGRIKQYGAVASVIDQVKPAARPHGGQVVPMRVAPVEPHHATRQAACDASGSILREGTA